MLLPSFINKFLVNSTLLQSNDTFYKTFAQIWVLVVGILSLSFTKCLLTLEAHLVLYDSRLTSLYRTKHSHCDIDLSAKAVEVRSISYYISVWYCFVIGHRILTSYIDMPRHSTGILLRYRTNSTPIAFQLNSVQSNSTTKITLI